ncbi:MAG: hypothetical protein AB7G75_25870 [Candidatus Binatia bacterium]
MNSNRQVLHYTIVRIQASVLALVGALIGGTGLFLMTVWLLLKGGPHVGAHLQLLAQYFIGYSVTWPGSVIGFFYGSITGGVLGWLVAWIYNWVADRRQMAINQISQ